MEYTVKVSGVEDLVALDKAVTGLEATLKAAKGSGKSLEEVRKIIVGLKGQGSVFSDLANAVGKIDPAISRLEGSFKGVGSGIARVLKSEMELLRQTLRTELTAVAMGVGSPVAKSISKEIGGGIDEGLNEATKRARSAAAKARAEMTAAYDKLVSGDGLKTLNTGELVEAQRLRSLGATISKAHAAQIKEYETYVAEKQRVAKQERQAAEDAARDAEAVAARDYSERLKSLSARAGLLRQNVRDQARADAEALAAQKEKINTLNRDIQTRAKLEAQNAAVAEEAKAKEVSAYQSNVAEINKFLDLKRRALAQAAAEEKAIQDKQLADYQSNVQSINKLLELRRLAIAQAAASNNAIRDSVAAASAKPSGAYSSLITQDLSGSSAQLRAYYEALKDVNYEMVQAATIKPAGVYSSLFSREMVGSSTQLKAFSAAVRDVNQEMVKAATASPSGAYSSLNTRELAGSVAQIKAYQKAMKDAAGDMRLFASNAGDAHAAVRGLASGFGALWLTWGNLGPLLAGAALSNTFMKAAKEGMQVAHTLEVVGALGGASSKEVSLLNQELQRVAANGPHGPIETAQALQTLVLAGVSAKDAMTQLHNVLDFSVAGTTSIEKASDVLVSVTTAFGTGADGFVRTSDIIVRAAADSKASVESFGEAMKTASVVGEQYGATQEDVAVLISLLANLGITGTSAGTAIRNMFTDLSGRSEKTSKILKRFELDFRDATSGNMKPLIEQVKEFDSVLRKMDAKSAKDLLQAILSERGGKAMVAALAAYNEQVDTAEGKMSKLELSLKRVENSFGDSAAAAARLGETTQNSWKTAGAALDTALLKVFEAMEPQLYSLAKAMQDLFRDPTFIEGLTGIGSALASVAQAVGSNIGLITAVAAGWGTWTLVAVAATAASKSLTSVTLGLVAAKAAEALGMQRVAAATKAYVIEKNAETAAVAAANLANATAGSVALGLIRALPLIGVAVAGVTVAWDLYTAARNRANSADKLAADRTSNVIKAMDDRAADLEKRTKAIQDGLDENQVIQETSDLKQFKAENAAIEKEIDTRKKLYEDAVAARQKVEKQYERYSTSGSGKVAVNSAMKAEEEALASLTQKQAEYNKLVEAYQASRKNVAEKTAAYEKAQEEKRAKAKAEAEKNTPNYLKNLSFDPADPYGTGKKSGNKGLSPLTTYFDEDFEAYKRMAEQRQRKIELDYKKGITSTEDYYSQLEEFAKQGYEKEKEALKERSKAFGDDERSKKEAKKALADLAILEEKYAIDSQERADKKAKAIDTETEAMRKATAFGKAYIENLEDSANSLVSLQRSGSFAAVEEARLKVAKDFLKRRQTLTENYEKDIDGLAEKGVEERKARLDKELEALKTQEGKAVVIVTDAEKKKFEERLKYQNGVQRALDSYYESSMDLASQAEAVTSKSLSSLEDMFVSAMTGAEFSVKSAVKSILADLARIAAKQIVVSLAVKAGLITDTSGTYGNSGSGGLGGLLSKASSVGTDLLGSISKITSFFGAGATAGASAGSLVAANAAGALGGDAIGTLIAANGGWSGVATEAALAASHVTEVVVGATTAAEAATTAAVAANSIGATAGSLLSSFGAALPWVGGALAVASLLGGSFGSRGANHSGAAASSMGGTSASAAEKLFGTASGDWYGDLTSRLNSDLEAKVQTTVKGLSDAYTELAKVGGIAAKNVELVGGFAANPAYGDESAYGYGALRDAITGDILAQFTNRDLGTDTTKAYDKFTAELGGLLVKSLVESDVAEWVKKPLKALGENYTTEQFAAAVKTIAEIDAGFKQLSANMSVFAGTSDAVKESLVSTAGSMSNLLSISNSFYENFYSEAERMATLQANVLSSLADIGVTVDTSTAENAKASFRKAVESAMAAGNAELTTKLLAMSQSFATAADYIAGRMAPLTENTKKLEAELLKAKGQTDAYKAAIRALETQGYSAAELAVYDYNASLQEQIDAANAASNATDTVTKSLSELATKAQGIVDKQVSSYQELVKSLAEEAAKNSGATVGGIALTGAEYTQFSKFSDNLTSATESLKELKDLGLGEEFAKYAEQIQSVVDSTKQLLSQQVANSRMMSGDFVGAAAAMTAASTLQYKDFSSSGAFNYASAKEQYAMRQQLLTNASANSLKIPNYGKAVSSLANSSAFPAADLYDPAREIRTQVYDNLGPYFAGILNPIYETLAKQGKNLDYMAVGYNAYTGQKVVGEEAVAYTRALEAVEGAFRNGRISVEEYDGALGYLDNAFANAKSIITDLPEMYAQAAQQAAEAAAAAYAAASSGFNQLSQIVKEFDAAATKASEAKNTIGLFNSMFDVFGSAGSDAVHHLTNSVNLFAEAAASALQNGQVGLADSYNMRAAMTGSYAPSYQGLLDKNQAVAEAAKIASQAVTTASAAEAAKALAGKITLGANQSMRDLSMLVQGVSQYDNQAFYEAFARISDALGSDTIDSAQYSTLFDYLMDTYKGVDKEAEDLADSFKSLRDSMKSFADELLIGDKTTLSKAQTLAEMNRQYDEAFRLAATGDSTGASNFQSLATGMLDKKLYSTQAEYNAAFGTIYGDARLLEAYGASKSGEDATVDAVNELRKEFDDKLSKLNDDSILGFAKVAKNTNDTVIALNALLIELAGSRTSGNS